MIKLSKLINEKDEGLSNPVVQKIDFNKPTVIHISDEEMKLLHQVTSRPKFVCCSVSQSP